MSCPITNYYFIISPGPGGDIVDILLSIHDHDTLVPCCFSFSLYHKLIIRLYLLVTYLKDVMTLES